MKLSKTVQHHGISRGLSSLRGVFVALLTPFDERGQIEFSVLRDLIEWLLATPVDGFYVAGSTGEGLLLTLDERKQLLESVLEHTAGRAPVIAHVGCLRTSDAVDLGKHAASAGAKAVSAIPPQYYSVGREGIELYYRRIAESSHLPLLLYTFSDAAGAGLDVITVRKLCRIPNVIGIKFSDYNLYQLQQMTRLLDGKFLVFNGADECLLSGLAAGAVGGIGGTYNMMPHLFVEVYRKFCAGDMRGAQEAQDRINQTIETLFSFGPSILNAMRAVMSRLGFKVHPAREPLPPLSEKDRRKLIGRLEEIGIFGWIDRGKK